MSRVPITALYAALFALWFLFLSLRVSLIRRRAQVGLGAGGDEGVQRRVRIHGNAAEFLPLAFLLMLLLEINTALVWPLHVIGIALLLGRLLHFWGVSGSSGVSPGRFTGMLLTWGAIAVLAVLNLVYAGVWVF